jgi:GxxExxY protein
MANFFDWREARGELADEETEKLAHEVIGAAIEVHRHLRAGHLEKFYKLAMCRELELRGIPYRCEVPMKVMYKGACLGEEKIDLLVGEKLVVELKSVSALNDVHTAQAMGYLAVSKRRLALLINYNVARLRDGIKRVVSDPTLISMPFFLFVSSCLRG